MKVNIKLLRGTPLPKYHTPGASAFDLTAAISADIVIAAGTRLRVPSGVILELPEGFEAQVRPKSGKTAAAIDVGWGTVDPDYRGEIDVVVINNKNGPITIRPGDRIAQVVIAPVLRVELVEADSLTETARGAGGFGSTPGS